MVVSVLLKVALLKKRTKGAADGSVAPDQDVPQSELAADPTSASQTPSEEQKLEPEIAEGKETRHDFTNKHFFRKGFLLLLQSAFYFCEQQRATVIQLSS